MQSWSGQLVSAQAEIQDCSILHSERVVVPSDTNGSVWVGMMDLRPGPLSTTSLDRASEVLFDVFEAKRRTRRRPSLLYCGNNDDAKSVVAQLIRDVGFEPVDAGPLRIARYLEPFTLAIAQLAYEGDEGPELACRIERFGK